MLEKILIGGAVGLALFLVFVATRAAAYRIERKIDVAAPADVVFGVLNDLHRFVGVMVLFGTPLEQVEPTMEQTFGGPGSGAGQSFSWSGSKAGKGSLTIEESVAGQKVTTKVVFVKPMASTAICTFSLASTATGTAVTWSMEGNHNFLGKAFGVFLNMDEMLGADIEKGLALLKGRAEAQ